MTRHLVSVVIETINTGFDPATSSLADDLAGTLAGLDRQTYPQELIERIIVLHRGIPAADAEDLCRRHPLVKFVSSLKSNYFAAKNTGAEAAAGEIVALLDGDCEPEPGWLEALVARFEPGVAAVAGRTHYSGDSWAAWTFTVPNFSTVLAEEGGAANGFNLNNSAFRREVLLARPLDDRIRRDGGCFFLFHQLRAAGARVLYAPRAVVAHGPDYGGLRFLHKHLNRGYDGVTIYRLDDGGVLRGTRLFRRLGAPALVAIVGRRIVIDWLRMLRHRRQIGIPTLALPYFGAVALVTRLIELVGGLMAFVAPRSSSPDS